ncbi:MAG: hypothetical protein B5M55_04935 [Desulfococcus sp. 4484_242]|nr:MAG: hypothetical protein B5M55_04935 [Desulfococcus sp. 4484_242]
MNTFVLNGSHHRNGKTAQLAQSVTSGPGPGGPKSDMIMLRDQTIGTCVNCLKCYGFTGKGISSCSLGSG